MFQPGALAAWVRTAGDMLRFVHSVKVRHLHPLKVVGSEKQQFRTSFVLRRCGENGPVVVREEETTMVWEGRGGERLRERGPCQCVVAQLASAANGVARGRPGVMGNPLMVTLLEYVRLVDQYDAAPVQDEKICDVCERAQSVG